MHVDSREFTSGSKTKLGEYRNAKQFWKLWSDKYPETLSTANLRDIKKGIAPMVDEHWIKHFPEHQWTLGETLEHHHIMHGNLTTALPQSIHRKGDAYKIWHPQGEY